MAGMWVRGILAVIIHAHCAAPGEEMRYWMAERQA